MTDEKHKPGRPRKWSSDAERMRAARAAKRKERRVAEERRAVRREQQERRTREKYSTAATSKSVTAEPASSVPDDAVADDDVSGQAEVDKLRAEVRRVEDEFDDVVYDRWIYEMQYWMAIHRMRQHDPDGLVWLDDQLRRWAIQRSGESEDRRRARRAWESGLA